MSNVFSHRWSRPLRVRGRWSKRYVKKHWLGLTTVFFVFAALIVIVAAPELEKSALIGDYLAGFAGALAFIWLIASFRQQSKELSLQRRELAMQRQALELQTAELANVAKFSAMHQVASIVATANRKLTELDPPIKTPFEISTNLMPSEDWKTMLESTDTQAVFEAHNRWVRKESAARSYLSALCRAAKLYFEVTKEQEIDPNVEDERFMLDYFQHISKMPYVGDYAGVGYSIASMFTTMERGLKSLNLAGWVATGQMFSGDIVNQETIEELMEYRRQHGGPPIAILGEDVDANGG